MNILDEKDKILNINDYKTIMDISYSLFIFKAKGISNNKFKEFVSELEIDYSVDSSNMTFMIHGKDNLENYTDQYYKKFNKAPKSSPEIKISAIELLKDHLDNQLLDHLISVFNKYSEVYSGYSSDQAMMTGMSFGKSMFSMNAIIESMIDYTKCTIFSEIFEYFSDNRIKYILDKLSQKSFDKIFDDEIIMVNPNPVVVRFGIDSGKNVSSLDKEIQAKLLNICL